MAHLHGYLEFRQLDEWYGVVDVGALLVPGARLTKAFLAALSHVGASKAPVDPSVAFSEMWEPVRPHVSATAFVGYRNMHELARLLEEEDPDLVSGTNLDVLLNLAAVLASRFGDDHVRLVVYAD